MLQLGKNGALRRERKWMLAKKWMRAVILSRTVIDPFPQKERNFNQPGSSSNYFHHQHRMAESQRLERHSNIWGVYAALGVFQCWKVMVCGWKQYFSPSHCTIFISQPIPTEVIIRTGISRKLITTWQTASLENEARSDQVPSSSWNE